MPSRVFILDDHPIFREGLRAVLSREPAIEIVGEASDGPSGRREIEQVRPDVVVLDIGLPGEDGLAVTRELRRVRPPPAVIILTMHREEAIVNQALDAGVRGYVLKDNAVTEIVGAVKSVAAGHMFLSPSVSGYLVRRRERQQAAVSEYPALETLTPMERRVLRLTAEGSGCRAIAAELGISHRTVETHRHNASRKLGLHGDHGLLQFAIEHRSDL